MVELDLTSAKSKAAYEEIREWGQGKYRLHMTRRIIAKTKRECGIIERVNYQPSQEREQPIPETPKRRKRQR
jgi:23S rRNA (uracil1939-C5)-methyltransferase